MSLCEQRFDQRALGIILIAKTTFFLDDFPLVLEFVRIENQPLHRSASSSRARVRAIRRPDFQVAR